MSEHSDLFEDIEENTRSQEAQEPQEEISPPPSNSISQHQYNPSQNNDIESVFIQLINLNNDNIMHEPTCAICAHPDRKEAEALWIKNKKPKEIKEFFKSKSELKASYDMIENHMDNHRGKGSKEIQKVEYVNKIRRISNVELTTLDRIKLGLAAIDERLVGINSIVPNNETNPAKIESIKSSETAKLVGAYNNLLKLKSNIMGEMHNQGDLIIIHKKSFIEVFNKAIAESENQGEKNVIMTLLSSLSEINRKTQ